MMRSVVFVMVILVLNVVSAKQASCNGKKEVMLNEINEQAKKYANGDGVEQDSRQAFNLYLKAARMGSARAENEIGRMYGNGWGVEQSCSESINWFEKAAKQNYAYATCNLATEYTNGHCAQVDYAKALRLQKKCVIATGSGVAMRYVAGIYRNGFNDSKNTFIWTLKAANNGDIPSLTLIGQLYYEGSGVKKDLKQARIWFTRAADKGDQNAINALRTYNF
jgi:TPR repeat protein